MNNMTPEEAYTFVKHLGLKRGERFEHIIMTEPEWACQYAYRIIKGRWTEAEREMD